MISENLPRRTGLATNAGPGKGFEWRGICASIVISGNLPCHTGFPPTLALGQSFEWRGIGASIEISRPFPAARGFPPTPGWARVWKGNPAGRGWEPGAGREEAGEIRMFNHWATGLRSGLLPQDCEVGSPEVVRKNKLLRSFR